MDHPTQPDAAPPTPNDTVLRLGGVLCMTLGAAFGWFFILRPLAQARAGAPEVSMQLKIAYVLVPLLFVWGAAFAVGGAKIQYRDTSVHPPKPLPMLWVLMGITAAAAGLLFWYVNGQFAALGYQ